MTPADLCLLTTIARHRSPDDDPTPPRLLHRLRPLLRRWTLAPHIESIALSGSHAKSTALRTSDVDIRISLSPDTPGPLAGIHSSLAAHFRDHLPLTRNVSIRIILDEHSLDLVPARRRPNSTHHTLWQSRYNTWLQTDFAAQTRHVLYSGLLPDILALKIWRRAHALHFPAFLLELAVIRALREKKSDVSTAKLASALGEGEGEGGEGAGIAARLKEVLNYLATGFPTARLLDPANSNNIVSGLLTPAEKLRIATAAQMSLMHFDADLLSI
jgi:predicted nucleotidyltransferase